MSGKGKKGERGNVIIKKEEIVEGGHHGGAWKVAYADFVTAMMAFFLLMWLLNATSEDQKRGIADYFSPINAMSTGNSGSGKPFGGLTPYSRGQMVSDMGVQSTRAGTVQPREGNTSETDPNDEEASAKESDDSDGRQTETAAGNADTAQKRIGARAPGGGQAPAQAKSAVDAAFLANAASARKPNPKALADAEVKAEAERRERAAFERAAEQIRTAIAADPAMQELAQQVAIDVTPEGLRIQLLDADRSPMFAFGSAALNDRARQLLQKVVPVLTKMPEAIAIAGHTDGAPFRGEGRTNWELSAERANATRRLMVEAGLQEVRFRSVTGNADRDPLVPSDPLAAANRRIAIMVLRTVGRGS